MRPNDHLIHSAARINYYSMLPDGREVLNRTIPLLRESVLVYLGEVVAAHHSPVRIHEDAAGVVHKPHPADLGWARLVVHYQGSIGNATPPIFEGAFSADGVIYHVMTKENYLRNKSSLDPDISHSTEAMNGLLVVWRESDLMTPEEEYLFKTGHHPMGKVSLPQSCGHDRLEYNTPSQNPIFGRSLSTSSVRHPSQDDSLPTNGGVTSTCV